MDRVPVLVVGGGTVGLSAALFLAHQGIAATLVERHRDLSIHPRATGIGLRTVEILRAHGLEEQFRAASSGLARSVGRGRFSVRTLTEAYQVKAPAAKPAADAAAVDRISPTSWGLCSQDRLDRLLLAAATERGAQARFGTELVELAQDDDGVTARMLDRESGRRYAIRADYVIATDGSTSPIRSALGVPTAGPGVLGNHAINVLFRADLREALRGNEFAVCEITHPDATGRLVAIDNVDHWVFHIAYHPDRGETSAQFSDERCRRLIRTAIGVPDLDVEVLSTLPWQSAAQVAETFRVGRVFLAGDAAHVVPPVGAFGMNTGIADAHNLAWKLAYVLSGRAGAGLLDSYDSERRPVARFTMDQALLRALQPDLHYDHTKSAERERLGMASALVVQLGYRYASEAVIGGCVEPPSRQDAERDLDGSPGSRVPHRWVDGSSTTDTNALTLLVGEDGDAWRAATDLPVVTVPDWPAIGPAGAMLVRPDGFVAWRTKTAAKDAVTTLHEVLARILAR